MKVFWPVALMCLLFVLSSIPGPSGDGQAWLLTDLEPVLQNALHVPLYGLLQWLWLRALVRPARPMAATVCFATLITVCYGCFDEFHQTLVPGRFASLMDVSLNILGAVIGTLFFLCMARSSGRLHVRR